MNNPVKETSQVEPPPQPPIYYRGRSMRGVFCPGDQLTLQSCHLEDVETGDLLVFTRGDEVIVHRVVGQGEQGLITCGDSNPTIDDQPVTADTIRGRVIACNRAGQDVLVRNGRRGFRQFRCHQMRWNLIFGFNRQLSRLLAPGAFSWLYRIEPQLLRLVEPLEWKIIHHQRSIGRFNPRSGSFQIRKPWYFFVSRSFIRTRLVIQRPKSDKI